MFDSHFVSKGYQGSQQKHRIYMSHDTLEASDFWMI